MAEKVDLSYVAYTLGIVSIVMAFLSPFGGIIFGIIGLVQSSKQKSALSKKAKILSIIGLILGVIMVVVALVINFYFSDSVSSLSFPS
jgi:uncharacterized membrane protein